MNTKSILLKAAQTLLIMGVTASSLALSSHAALARIYVDPPQVRSITAVQVRQALTAQQRYVAMKLQQAERQ